jgi:LysR family transcriptional regulator, transcription activator of glutamate synthase operon
MMVVAMVRAVRSTPTSRLPLWSSLHVSITPAGSEAHPVVEVLQRSAHDAGFEPAIAFQANDYQEAQAMVSVGMGVAMVPKTAVALQHPDVRVLSLGPAAPLRRVLLAQRQDKVYAPAEVAFHSTLLEIARERSGDYL